MPDSFMVMEAAMIKIGFALKDRLAVRFLPPESDFLLE